MHCICENNEGFPQLLRVRIMGGNPETDSVSFGVSSLDHDVLFMRWWWWGWGDKKKKTKTKKSKLLGGAF